MLFCLLHGETTKREALRTYEQQGREKGGQETGEKMNEANELTGIWQRRRPEAGRGMNEWMDGEVREHRETKEEWIRKTRLVFREINRHRDRLRSLITLPSIPASWHGSLSKQQCNRRADRVVIQPHSLPANQPLPAPHPSACWAVRACVCDTLTRTEGKWENTRTVQAGVDAHVCSYRCLIY